MQPKLQRLSGAARVGFSGPESGLTELYQSNPCRVLLPRHGDGPVEAVLLNTAGGILNAVINAPITDSGNPNAIGLDDEGNTLVADGSGGYTTEAGYTITNNQSRLDYADMAFATGGASWDLNILRLGGNDAISFTDAFVDVKVGEIEEQVLPEPGMMIIFGLGFAGIALRRRMAA